MVRFIVPVLRLLLFFCIILVIPLTGYTQKKKKASTPKTDIVILENSDHITGEIRKLRYGLLTFKTDNAGTPDIKWAHVHLLTSIHEFEVELVDGRQFYGSLEEPDEIRTLVIKSEKFRFVFKMDSVVDIVPIKNKFWNRFAGSVSLGASYTKASTVGQINYNSEITYTTKKNITQFSWDGNFTTQEGKDNTQRQDITLMPNWNLKKRWFVNTMVGAEQNSELGLDLRMMVGGGMGRSMIQTNRNNMISIAGLLTTREWTADSAAATFNLEGYMYFDYQIFKHDSPKTDFRTNVALFPGLTDWGRVRMQINFNVSQELIKDFTININFYDTYDNKPSAGSSKNDWGITLGFGYSFNK
jgi:putative salt-induced outer membrane protein YdiY